MVEELQIIKLSETRNKYTYNKDIYTLYKPTPVFLPGKCHDRGAWQVTICGVTKSPT